MSRPAHSTGQQPPENGYRVQLPRSCDAIGGVLRDAYGRDMSLPDDMMALLRKISGRPATSCDR